MRTVILRLRTHLDTFPSSGLEAKINEALYLEQPCRVQPDIIGLWGGSGEAK